eukprot:sb/3476068/
MNFRSRSKAIVFGSRFYFKCDQEKLNGQPQATQWSYSDLMTNRHRHPSLAAVIRDSPPLILISNSIQNMITVCHVVVRFGFSWSHLKENREPKTIALLLDRKFMFFGMTDNVHSYQKNEF